MHRVGVLPLLAIVLAVGAVGAGWRAHDLDGAPLPVATASAPTGRVTTPVLSVRRTPIYLQAPFADAQLSSDIDKKVMAISPADTCVMVSEGQRVIYSKNETKALTPASNLKLLTALGALDVLGGDTRLRTKAMSDATRSGGVLNGSLYLVGGGDPLLSTTDYIDRFTERYGYQPAFTDIGALADRIAALGITEIRGDIVGDDRHFDAERAVPSWPARLITQGQIGPLSALAVNDGFTSFAHDPEVTTANVVAANPAQYTASVFVQQLKFRNVRVTGTARSGATTPAATELASIDSPTVNDMVAELLTLSDNNTAELLTKEIGLKARNEASTSAGVSAIRDVLAKRNYPLGGVTFVDGSGLDPADRVTCALVMTILNDVGPTSAIGGHLPIAGKTGTLHDRYRSPPIQDRVRAKTGRLLNVSAMSGYASTLTNRGLTFSYITNVASDLALGDRGINAQNELAALLVAYPQAPALDQLGPRTAQG